MPLKFPNTSNAYDRKLKALQDVHHSQCLFQHKPPVDDLRFGFSENGVLKGRFVFSEEHQGFAGIVHGGVIASIIDASMAQCCMGHGLVAYTGDLSIRYRNPVRIAMPTFLETRIVRKALSVLFSLECNITQEGAVHVDAKGRFFKVPIKK
jgi:acyl-coenzyme A thioesterase PaaI-like protein